MPALRNKRSTENVALSNSGRTNSKTKKVHNDSTTNCKSNEPLKAQRNPEKTNPKPKKVENNSTKSFDTNKLVNVQPINYHGLLNTFMNFQIGYGKNIFGEKSLTSSIIGKINNLVPYETISPFQRRTTAMQWHPSYSNLLVAGSKGGELYLWNINDKNRHEYLPGIGPGGSITQLKVNDEKPTIVFTSCLTGEVSIRDLETSSSQSVFHSGTMENWFVSLDVNISKNMMVAGDCKGRIYTTSCDGQKSCQSVVKLHKSKILHVEFNKVNPDLLVTTSLDRHVKLWDLRNMEECLMDIVQEKPINSACFNPRDGTYLLTTDQHNSLRVYTSPFWDLTQNIKHPHRQFQHLTPIKASWHPTLDIAVVGRFPESGASKLERSIDFYSTTNGELLTHLIHNEVPGICSLNMFNNTGECLASAMGCHIILWKSLDLKDREIMLLMEKMTDSEVSQRVAKTKKVRSNITKSKEMKRKKFAS